MQEWMTMTRIKQRKTIQCSEVIKIMLAHTCTIVNVKHQSKDRLDEQLINYSLPSSDITKVSTQCLNSIHAK